VAYPAHDWEQYALELTECPMGYLAQGQLPSLIWGAPTPIAD
jgi:hypothetical protein